LGLLGTSGTASMAGATEGRAELPLETMGRSAGVAAWRAVATASDASSAAAEVSARISAAVANEAASAAEEAADMAEIRRGELGRAVDDTRRAQAGAVAAAAAAERAYRMGEAAARDAERVAAGDARRDIERRLAPLYRDLQEWKMAVLHDPEREGKAAGVKAAQPFEDAMKTAQAEAGEYGRRAAALGDRAWRLRNRAAAMVRHEGGKALSDPTVRPPASAVARNMLAQAEHYELRARKLREDAKALLDRVPKYAAAAQYAAQDALYWVTGNKFAPAPKGWILSVPSLQIPVH